MSTPLSATSSYCTPAQLLSYCDKRQLGDWVLDRDQRDQDPVNNFKVQDALDAGAGMIESACVVGEKYTPLDLQTLTGVSQKTLQMMNGHLAVLILQNRRDPSSEPPTMAKWALEHLERLRLGERIFGLQETANAGLPKTEFMTQQDFDTLDLASDQARRYFGVRAKSARLLN